MLVMEEKGASILESVCHLFGKLEAVEVPMPEIQNDESFGPLPIQDVAQAPPMLGETTEINEAATLTCPFYETGDITAITDDQTFFERRRRSFSLIDINQEEEEEENRPKIVRQRTHPRERRSERRRTIRSGLNLLLPRNQWEVEDSTDVTTNEHENTDPEKESNNTELEHTNDKETNVLKKDAKSNDPENDMIKDFESNSGGNIIDVNNVTPANTDDKIDKNGVDPCSSVTSNTDATPSSSVNEKTMCSQDFIDASAGHSSSERESPSSDSPPPLPEGSPPNASLLRQYSFMILGPNRKPPPLSGSIDKGSANFVDELSAQSSFQGVESVTNQSNEDLHSPITASTTLVQQDLYVVDQPKSSRSEFERSTSARNLATLFSNIYDKETQSSPCQVDSKTIKNAKLSRSELSLLYLSSTTRTNLRHQRIKTVCQAISKQNFKAGAENTSEIRQSGVSVDNVESTEGMKFAFSESCLAETTLESEFSHFIQMQIKRKASSEAVNPGQNIDTMSPNEQKIFEEFCENFRDEQPDDNPPYNDLQEDEDPTQKLVMHLLSKPLKQTSNDVITTGSTSTNQFSSQDNSANDENLSASADPQRSDSIVSIVPSVLLAQCPKSVTRMSSVNEDEIDSGSRQNTSDESIWKPKKDHLSLDLDSATRPSGDTPAPPLPPKSSSFRHARESLKCELSERRGTSLNLEDDMRASSPPPLPPRRGGSLVICGTSEMSHRLPPSLMTTRMGTIAGTPNNDNAQILPVLRVSKSPREMRDRKCLSSIVHDDKVQFSIEKSNFSDPNLSYTKTAPTDPPELPPRNGPSVSLEHSHHIHTSGHHVLEPPPRPPPFMRSMSTREGRLEKAAAFVMTSKEDPFFGHTSSLKKYADQLARAEWIEARNDMIDIEIIPSQAASAIPPSEPSPEPPLQHFPVKLDGTHHRLSIVSNSSSECHPSFQSHSNGAFHLTEDEKLDLTDQRLDSQAMKQKLLLRQKSSSSSSDTDSNRKFNPPSRSSSSNTSGRRREKFLAGFKADGPTTSSVNLLSDEAPVPSNATLELEASSFYDLSADNFAYVRDRQDDDPQLDEVPQSARLRNLAKRLSEVSVVGWTSRKKEEKKSSKTKDVHHRNLMSRFTFLRDTSARGVPSDLVTIVDSTLTLNEFERFDSYDPETAGGSILKNASRKKRSKSTYGEEILHRGEPKPPEPYVRYSAGTAEQMIMATKDQVDDTGERETNNNSNQKNSDRIIQVLTNLKHDMVEYTRVLEGLQKTYEEMRSKTPDGIRQRFDLAFKEVRVMHQLQLELNSRIVKDEVDLSVVAEAFKTKDFSTYKRYSILARDLQKEIKSHSSHFSENFQQFSSNIMKPFHRLNTYSLYLQSFLNNYLDETESKLQEAVSYLNNLKQEANTEMNICDLQKCPVELRLAGLISFSGNLHYDGDLLPKQVYVMLFESILVICEDNHDYRVYKQHYRSEQVGEIKEVGDLDIEIKVHPTYQSNTIQLKFKANLASDRKAWITRLHTWQEANKPSFRTITLNPDLQRNIQRKHDRFLPLSLWTLNQPLKTTVDMVKHNRVDEKTVKLNKIHNNSRPNSGEDAIFSDFMMNVEDFVSRLDVLLDHEARAPHQLLGSILRKLRRFYKSVFLPQLRADFEKQPEKILDCIIGKLPNFPPLFREYIEIRSGLTLVMEDGLACTQYISPFKHLSFFIEWLFTLSCIAKYHVMLRGQLSFLVNCVEDARVTLLHSAIVNCQLDFYKTGDIVRHGCLESKLKCHAVKGNQVYYVILFEKAILFTRPKIPQYEFVHILWLDQVTFGPQPDHKCSFKLEERSVKKIYVYELKAESENEKKKWQSDIHVQLHRQVEFVKKSLS